jgi:hypothetical protein
MGSLKERIVAFADACADLLAELNELAARTGQKSATIPRNAEATEAKAGQRRQACPRT